MAGMVNDKGIKMSNSNIIFEFREKRNYKSFKNLKLKDVKNANRTLNFT